MVRLKALRLDLLRTFFKFQFHYGTIKSKAQREEVYALTPFQFHYGTIKREKTYLFGYIPYLFQFHYGTIKR